MICIQNKDKASMENNTQQNQTGNGPGEVESDSGDSLFLTQKPVPKAVRSGRPRRLSQRSTPISQSFLEDSGSSSESSEDVPGRRTKPRSLPKYNFPFLKQSRRRSSYFSSQSNKILHYYAMGGFFNCVTQLSSCDKKSKSDESLLPTADEGTEEITPLTEEEEKSDEEDIKIVSKKTFVYSLQPHRTKSSHLKPQKKKHLGKVTSKKDSAKNTVKRTLFTSNKHLDLQRNNSNQHPSSDSCDSDATLIDESRSIAQKDVSENLTLLQPSARPVSPTEELDDTESQSILQNITSDITGRIDNSTCKEKRLLKTKKGDEIDHQDKLVNEDIAENQESGVLEDYSTKSPPGVLHYDNIPKKKTNTCIAENDRLHNQPENVSCDTENRVNGQILNEDVEMVSSCLVETLNSDDSRIRKKKKKGDQENVEIETGRSLDPGQILNNVQLDNTDNIQVHEEVSELIDKGEKHKKKQKANSDNYIEQEDVSPKKHKKRLKLDDISLSKSVESHKQPELVNLKSSATDSITTQSDESVSVQKKKKKKRPDSFVDAETVENSHLLLSQSGDGDGADTLGISTNETESAENGGQLHEPVLELGNSVKRKKKKKHHDNAGVYNYGFDKPDTLGLNTKAIESTKISGKNKRNQSEERDSTEVAHPQSDECEQLKKKKKKKKKSKHESHHADITNVQQMSQREEEESVIKGLNAFENQVMKKKKRKHYDDDVDEGKSEEKTELEQSTVKRKKHKKDRIKHDNPDVSSQSYVEMSPSFGCPVKNKSQMKVKKRLYNPNDDYLQEF